MIKKQNVAHRHMDQWMDNKKNSIQYIYNVEINTDVYTPHPAPQHNTVSKGLDQLALCVSVDEDNYADFMLCEP